MKRSALAAVLVMLVIGAEAYLNPTDIRLPRKVWPHFYNLYITTSVCEDNPDFSFYGQVDINVEVKIATSTIKINAKHLNISFAETTLKSLDRNELIPVSSQDIDEEHEFLIIHFPLTLCTNCVYVLHIEFKGILRTDLKGYYRSEYIDTSSGVRKWSAVTQFQATDARRAFPCFDEPEYKATFKIHLGRPRSCTALSNMPLIITQNIEGLPDWVMDEFDITKKMSTYLVAWAVTDFQCVNSLTDGRIRVCSRPDGLIYSNLALSVGPASLRYYEKYFDVAYPLPKSDMIAVPDFDIGAMENWGLITYREALLLSDESSATLTSKYKIAYIISHELAHQWFGNLVTMKWWSDLWLNEGFATFVASLGVHNAFPHWNSRQVEAVEELLSVSSVDSLVSSHAISLNISHPNEITQMFDVISYKKGSLLLRMTSLFLGEEVFRRGVINYLKKYKYGNADRDDLYHELTKEARKHRVLSSGLTLKEILDTWTLQTGHPMVTVRREGRSLVLTQRRFLFYRIARTRLASIQPACWYIPITLTTQSEQDFARTKPLAWMKCDVSELVLTNAAKEDEWYILNMQAAGIYRVFYDLENWKAISKTLNSRHYKNIAVMNRVQILNDIMHFTWTADIDADVAFRLIGYIRRETEFLPWRVALHNLERVKNIFSRTIYYNVFMTWVRRLLKPAFERVGNPEPDDLHGTRHHGQLFRWACEMQIDTCIYQARVFYAQWMRSRNPARNDVIPIYLRSISTCISVKYGGEQEWEFAWNAYLTSSDGSVKVEFLKALGCSSQPWILRRYLQWMLEEHEIRQQDADHVFLSVVQNDVGFTVAKEFFMANIEKLTNLFGSRNSHFRKWIKELANMMFTEEEYEEFSDFTDTNKRFLEGAEMAVSQSKEVIRDTIRWYKRNFPHYVAMMEKYKIRREMN